MSSTAHNVIPLPPNRIGPAAEMLGRAFLDDPLTEFLFPDPDRRPGECTWLKRYALRYTLPVKQTYTVDSGLNGVAVWLPPGDEKHSLIRHVQAGALMFPLKIRPASVRRIGILRECFEVLHSETMKAPHWYLLMLGVDPERQGTGIGSALVQNRTSVADQQGVECYLETTKLRNVGFYESLGFEVVYEKMLPDGGPRFWTMRRPPRL